MIKAQDIKKEPESPKENESSGWSSNEEEEGGPGEQIRWIDAGGLEINRDPNETWEVKEKWTIRDMKDIVRGTPTPLLQRGTKKPGNARRAICATTMREKEGGKAPPAKEPAVRGDGERGAKRTEAIRRAVSGTTREEGKATEAPEPRDAPERWPEGNEGLWSRRPALKGGLIEATGKVYERAAWEINASTSERSENNWPARQEEEVDKDRAWNTLGKWGLCTITPNLEDSEALRRASKGLEVDRFNREVHETLRGYYGDKTEMTKREAATLALTRCPCINERVYRLNADTTHYGECNEIEGAGPSSTRTTHTIGMFGPEGRRAVCQKCGRSYEDKKAYECWCLRKVLPLLEDIRTGGTVTLQGDLKKKEM